jgi:hypothetical protein
VRAIKVLAVGVVAGLLFVWMVASKESSPATYARIDSTPTATPTPTSVDPKFQLVQRQVFAKTLENAMLDRGINCDVYLSGKNSTTLTLKYVLATKVFIRQFETSDGEGENLAKMRQFGFRRFIITDGDENTWTWKLSK